VWGNAHLVERLVSPALRKKVRVGGVEATSRAGSTKPDDDVRQSPRWGQEVPQ